MNLFLTPFSELPSLRVRLRLAFYGTAFSVIGAVFSSFHEQVNNTYYSLVCFITVAIGVFHFISILHNWRTEKTLRKKCKEAGVPYSA